MPEHSVIGQKKREKTDQDKCISMNNPQAMSQNLMVWDISSYLGEPVFNPPIQRHTALFVSASAEQKIIIARQLQQTYGNKYVQRLVESVGSQAELTLSHPNDVYEKEAGQEEKKGLHIQPNIGQSQSVSRELEKRIDVACSSGQRLSDDVREPMEQAFSVDFSNVRIHTNSEADSLSLLLNAKAFTRGQDIFFKNGEYNPGSSSGQKLIAHELTHVVQQSVPSLLQRRAVESAHNIIYKEDVKEPEGGTTTAKPAYSIVYKDDFKESEDGVTLNSNLNTKLEALCNSLIKNGKVNGNITFNEGVRSKKKAHKWHTAWMIRNGNVTIAKLKELKDGMDKDGNIWWKAEWNALKDEEALAKAKEHAGTIWSRAYAAEGYPAGDVSRLPCDCTKGVTNHKDGNAIDASIPWTIGAWSEEAKTLVDNAGLKRPVSSEHWHFELK